MPPPESQFRAAVAAFVLAALTLASPFIYRFAVRLHDREVEDRDYDHFLRQQERQAPEREFNRARRGSSSSDWPSDRLLRK